MKIVVTGADGFLGWHLRVRLRALTDHHVEVVNRDNWSQLSDLMAGADAILHVAGVNRGTDFEVEAGNINLARHVVAAIRAAGAAPRIVFANSIQSGNSTAYGTGKALAAAILADVAAESGGRCVDVRLPNLFGSTAGQDTTRSWRPSFERWSTESSRRWPTGQLGCCMSRMPLRP